MKLQVQVLIENPGNSYLFQFPPLQSILRRIGSQRVETFLGSYGMDISKKLGPCVVLCNYQSKVLNKRAWLMSRKLHSHGTATWAAGLFREDPSRKRKREGESSLASRRMLWFLGISWAPPVGHPPVGHPHLNTSSWPEGHPS